MPLLVNQFLKIPTAMFAAALVTTTLFFVMHLMVHSDDERIQETFIVPVIDARMPEIEIEEPVLIERPEPIVEPAPPIDDPAPRDPAVGSGPVVTYQAEYFDVDPPMISGLSFQDSEMVPIVRTTPVYPNRALQRQIEGFVVVSFTVDENGNVTEPSVTYAEPEGIFERAALQSIAKWRYAARVKNGKPVAVHGVQQRIVFEMAR